MDLTDDIVKEFLVESNENLDRLDQDLMALEESPDDRDKLSSVFRAIHTIKGTSGFLAFPKLEHVTHVGESLLVLLRDGKLRLNGVIANGLLALVDAVRQIMANIESGQGEGDADYADLVATLDHLQVTGGVETPRTTLNETAAQRTTDVLETIAAQVETLVKMETDAQTIAVAPIAASRPNDTLVTPPAPTATLPNTTKTADRRRGADHRVTVDHEPGDSDKGQSQSQRATDVSDAPIRQRATDAMTDSTIRIDVALLDKLMNLVGELVLVRNQILQYSRTTEDAALVAASQRLNLITSELQEGVMKTRMQPIQNVWAKLPRIVRDLSPQCGKKVQVKMEGAETELDKTILEAIKDPLMHIVRNSVDHGIETPEIREAQGKPAEGTLLLRASHEGGQVIIEISDDGAGIHLDRVKQKAINQGLITSDQASSMSERELMNLILLPGFSTAAAVTNVSGRGVGMDVVKTNVEKIGGTLDIHSVFGQGMTLRIKIPLTLAIVPALMVTCGEDVYAIPQNNLVELVRLEGERVQREIEHIHGVPVYRRRGNILPLLYLDEQLQLRPARTGAELRQDGVINIVVLNAENRLFGLVVNQINDTQEIVVKPLRQNLKEISTYAGATIMGDGTVALILDVIGFAKRAKVLSEVRDRHVSQLITKEQTIGESKQTLLLFGLGENQRMAIPLSLVTRLEEISISSVEKADNQQVVQYGGKIMTLINLGDVLNSKPSDGNGTTTLQVVVYSENGRSVGLVVDRILDIVETTLTIQHPGKRLGILGSAVIQNRVTDLLDIHNLLLSTHQDLFAPSAAPTALAV